MFSLIPRASRLPRIDRLEREMDNLMSRFWPGDEDWNWNLVETFNPRTNVVETDGGFEIALEMPGMKPEDFKLELKGNELWISGEKKKDVEEKGKTFHRVEHHYGEFRRMIPLPGDVKEDKVDAIYRDGILKVVVPKAETVKPKAIEVKT